MEDPKSIVAVSEPTGPRNSTEAALFKIWKEVFGEHCQFSVTTKFLELGGHSLLAVKIASRIKAELGYDVGIPVLFQYNSIESLGQYLQFAQAGSDNENKDYDLLDL
jgi:hypothetical protein